MVFVHGGLNKFDSALKRAARLQNEIPKDTYPIFIIWDSSLRSSYLDHLLWIRQGRIWKLFGPFTSVYYFNADIGRALTRAPIVIFYQFVTDLKNAFPSLFTSFKNINALYLGQGGLYERYCQDYKSETRPKKAIAISCGSSNRSVCSRCLRFFLYWITFPIKLYIAPFIDAMGKSAWENMLRRTQTLFRKPLEFDIRNNRDNVGEALDSPPTGALSRFMDSLNGLVKNDADYEITLIGHSMGTIVLNGIIRNYNELLYKNIVYMAAACTIGDFEKSVIPYLVKNQDTKFYNLCLNPIAEVREINFFGISPYGSLLEWIDNFFSSPLTTLDRTLGKWENLIQATHIFPESIRGRVNIKAFNATATDPKDQNPTKHADFTKMNFWEEKFWKPAPPL